MRGSNGARSEHRPFRIEPESGKPFEDRSQSAGAESCGVLDEDERRLGFGDDAEHLEPETASGASETSATARCRDVLARESTGDDVALAAPGATVKADNIASNKDLIPESFTQDVLAVGFPFDRTYDGMPEQDGGQEASADAGEEMQVAKHQWPMPSGATRTTTPTRPPSYQASRTQPPR